MTTPSRPARTQNPRGRGQSRTQPTMQNPNDFNPGRRGEYGGGYDAAANSPQSQRPRQGYGDFESGARPKQDNDESYKPYTVIAPNEKKRQQVTRQAEAERQAYEEHKKKMQLGHVSYVGTAGGGQQVVSEHTARMRAQQHNKSSVFNSKQKAQEWRDNKKRIEEREIQRKRNAQREKSYQNKANEQARQEQLRDDHYRKNQAFLDRLERQSGGR